MTESHKNLTSSEMEHLQALISESKKRKSEDENLGCLVGGTLGAGGGVIATILTPMTGGAPAIISGAAGCAAGKDFVGSKYDRNNNFSSDEEHYKSLLQDERLRSSKNRNEEDMKLGCEVGKEIGTNVGSIIGPRIAAINGAIGCGLGEWVVEKKHASPSADDLRTTIRKWEKELNEDIDNAQKPNLGPPLNIPAPPPPKDSMRGK